MLAKTSHRSRNRDRCPRRPYEDWFEILRFQFQHIYCGVAYKISLRAPPGRCRMSLDKRAQQSSLSMQRDMSITAS